MDGVNVKGSVLDVLGYGEKHGAARVELVKLDNGDELRSYRLFDPVSRQIVGDTVTPAPKERSYTAQSVDALVELAATLAMRACRTGLVTVRVSLAAVTVDLDEELRRDRITLPLSMSRTWDKLRVLAGLTAFVGATADKLIGERPMKQDAIRKLLKTGLDADLVPNDIAERVSAVKINKSEDGSATVGHGSAAVSRSIIAKVVGLDTLPEAFEVIAAVWDNVFEVGDSPGEHSVLRRRVQCALDVDVAAERFDIRPLEGEIQAAEQSALAWLVSDLRARLEGAWKEEADKRAALRPVDAVISGAAPALRMPRFVVVAAL